MSVVQVGQEEKQINLSNGLVTIIYDLESGKAKIEGNNGFCLSGIHSAVKLSDGRVYNSTEPGTSQVNVEEIQDDFGQGKVLSVSKEYKDAITLLQKFYLYKDSYLIAETSVKSEERIGSNEISVLKAETITFPEGEDMRYLFTPFDNDDFIRYAALPFSEIRESYEISAVYDAASRNGMVVGSISHSTWKTGIRAQQQGKANQQEVVQKERHLPKTGNEIQKESASSLSGLDVIAGVTSKITRDTLPHGIVYGTQIDSPKIFLGFYNDYRDGLEAYGQANRVIAEPFMGGSCNRDQL